VFCARSFNILGTLSTLIPLPAYSQTYPTRSIELIVHTSAGSGDNIVYRAVREIMRREKLLPQPLQVVNRLGGSGALAFNFFKIKPADRYVL
jgi:tripartite-type tricarboxylate transporter receptor subunit TctC